MQSILIGFLTGWRGLLQKHAYESYAGCDFDGQIAGPESLGVSQTFPRIRDLEFFSGASARHNLRSIILLRK
jgi:hypothetical protein